MIGRAPVIGGTTPHRATEQAAQSASSRARTLWVSLKGVELANLAGDTLREVTAAAERGIERIRGTPHLPFSFLRHCGQSSHGLTNPGSNLSNSASSGAPWHSSRAGRMVSDWHRQSPGFQPHRQR
jgi:hypothetical protein